MTGLDVAAKPRMMFEGPYFESGHDIAVTPDGKGFILIRENDTVGPRDMQVVANWTGELRQTVRYAWGGSFDFP